MPRNEPVAVGATPVELTATDVDSLCIWNEGPGSVRLAGSATASQVLEPGYILAASVLLTDIWPGVAGVKRVFAVATGPSDATLFVSHA